MNEPLKAGTEEKVSRGKNLLAVTMRAIRNSFETSNWEDLHYLILQHRTLMANMIDPSLNSSAAKKYINLINEERRKLAVTKRSRQDDSDREKKEHEIQLECHKRINALYVTLGMAKMLMQGDWSVNRSMEIPASMGVASFTEIESMLLNFQYENGLIENKEPLYNRKLAHLDLGCGNGVVGHYLRQNNTEHPFGNEHGLSSYWEEIGYADFIYWTLNDLLRAFAKDEYKDNPGLNEFIDTISTLLMRKIQLETIFGDQSPEIETLLKLPTNPNVIAKVLLNLGILITTLPQTTKIRADMEFLSDADKSISTECRSIIEEFFGDEATITREPAAFIEKYFKPELYAIDYPLEKAVEQVNEKLRETKLKLDKHEFNLDNIDQSHFYLAWKAERRARQRCLKRYKKLARRHEKIFTQEKDISRSLIIYPHNVIFGKFKEFGDLFPDKPTFDFVHSKRATSHAENHVYKKLMGQVARRLKPGGIMIEDGKRESYTREERIDELVTLQKELGPEYKVGVIADGERTKSVLIQRAITKPDGEMVFFADSYSGKLIKAEHDYCPIEECAARWPEVIFRNGIIRKFKAVYIDETLKDAMPDTSETRSMFVHAGRMRFKGLHEIIDRVLKEQVFETDTWADLRDADPSTAEYQKKLQEAWELITAEREAIKRRSRISKQ